MIFYTSHCPKCNVLKKLMDTKNIQYQEIDNEAIYLSIAEKHGIVSMPFAEINGKIYNSKELQEYINKREVRTD